SFRSTPAVAASCGHVLVSRGGPRWSVVLVRHPDGCRDRRARSLCGASCPRLWARGVQGNLQSYRRNLQSYLLPTAAPMSARRMVGNIFPHCKINRPSKATPVEDAGPPRCDSMVGLLRPGFRRLQGLDSGQYKPASWRSRRALIEISLHSAIGDRPPGLVVVEIAELPDQPPQADPALWPRLALEAGQRQLRTASQTFDTAARNCVPDDVAPHAPVDFEPGQLGIDGDRTRRGRVEGPNQLYHPL